MYAIYSLANAAWVLEWWKILTLCKVDFCLGYRTSGRGVCLFSLIFKLLDKSMSFFVNKRRCFSLVGKVNAFHQNVEKHQSKHQVNSFVMKDNQIYVLYY